MKKIFFSTFFLLNASVFAWWDTPHMAIAQIAYERLDPAVKKQVDILSSEFGKPFSHSPDFVTSSCWADDIATDGFCALQTWHYSDLPYDPEGILTPCEKENFIKAQVGKDIIFAMTQAVKTLENGKATPWTKGLMLRFLIHFVGDAHQPVHAVTYFSERFPYPCGDAGANLFPIRWEGQPKEKLHCFWDSGCGLVVERLKRPLDSAGKDELNRIVKEVTSKFPENEMQAIDDLNFTHWRDESYQLATQYVYPGIQPGCKPDERYIQKGQQVCARQIALAGYRLAKLLNKTLNAESSLRRP